MIRKRLSDLIEGNNFAQNPRHVHHQIPNLVFFAADEVMI
jgi:hypothetical protein